jgi:hypothetical protein
MSNVAGEYSAFTTLSVNEVFIFRKGGGLVIWMLCTDYFDDIYI